PEPSSQAPLAQAQPKTEGPKQISAADYLGSRPAPRYPRMAQRRGEQGRVVIRVLITPKGAVERATVHQSSGHDLLDEAALKAAKKAKFKPYTENGIALKALA